MLDSIMLLINYCMLDISILLNSYYMLDIIILLINYCMLEIIILLNRYFMLDSNIPNIGIIQER